MEKIYLWKDQNIKTQVDRPSIAPMLLDSPAAPAILIIPGGGYGTVCVKTTPFGLALAPGLPWADEPSPRNLRFSTIMIPT